MTYLRTAGWLQPGQVQPWVEIGEKVVIKRLSHYFLYRVENLEQLPQSSPVTIDFALTAYGGSVAAGAIHQGVNSITALQMNGFELAQYRVRILDDFEMQVSEIQSIPKFLNMVQRARISKMGQLHDPFCAQSEIAVYQDEVPFFDILNPNPVRALNVARAAFFGFRYQLTNIGDQNPDQHGNRGYDGYNAIGDIPGNYTVVMGEGFSGAGYRRAGD